MYKTVFNLLYGLLFILNVWMVFMMAREYPARPVWNYVFLTGYFAGVLTRFLFWLFVRPNCRMPFYLLLGSLLLLLLWLWPFWPVHAVLFSVFIGFGGWLLYRQTRHYVALKHFYLQYQEQPFEDILIKRQSESYAYLKKSYDDLLDQMAANQALFLNVSHDLRTPIAVIKGYLDLLMEPEESSFEERQQYLERIQVKIDYLNKLIDDLFLLTRLEERKLSLNRSELDLNMLIRNVVYDMSGKANKKDIHISMSLSEGEVVRPVDEVRFYQVIENILDNAIKFTGCGGVIHIKTKRTDSGQAYIYIQDSGVGMSESQLDKLFCAGSVQSPTNGQSTGLGLKICRELVLYHGGTLCAKSKPGEGTGIHITI